MKKKYSTLTIRPFQEGDYEAVCHLFLDAFSSKFIKLSGLDRDALNKVVESSGMIERKPFDGYIVAVADDAIAATLKLEWKGQYTSDSGFKFSTLVRELGFLKALRFAGGMAFMKHHTKKGECYISHIAVGEDYRGMGIGSELLKEAVRICESYENLDYLSLFVAGSNHGAHALYERMGFKDQQTLHSNLMKWFFDEKTWIYMVRKGV